MTYSNEKKTELLGVKAETLEKHGAVSSETALEMSEGARLRSGADIAVAVTGIAGPAAARLKSLWDLCMCRYPPKRRTRQLS